ncbi:MAG: VWA domain-containing protein [Planctomycetes bacterium]|nr:VWA domain-containing protein [Planctomycetota bacterium]
MSFEHPLWLVLLLLLPVLEWWLRRSAPKRPLWLSAVQLLALALVVLALAQPTVQGVERAPALVVVVDRSASMGGFDAEIERLLHSAVRATPADRVQVVVCAANATVLLPTNGRYVLPPVSSQLGTGLSEALQLAADLIPAGEAGKVLLLGDGRGTRGEAREAAARMGQRGLVLQTQCVGAQAPAPVLREVNCPSRARAAETISISAQVDDPSGLVAEAVLRSVEPSGTDQRVVLESGTLRAEHELLASGLNRMELLLRDAAGATLAQVPLACVAAEPVRVRHVQHAAATPRGAAVRALLGAGFEIETDPGAPVDVTILDDVPAEALDAASLAALGSAVRAGGGLLVCGGRHSFGPGGYGASPLDQMLPLAPDEKEERRDPSATLVIIIDTSGSMSGARIDIAKEVARLALQRLKPHDKAGIVEFHGAKRWAAPIQSAANAVDLQRALNRLTAGGGTVILPAIEEAYYAMLNVRTRTRHVLVITDGGVESGDFESLLRRMADKGITTSTVLAGAGSGHSSFLFSIAQWGRGRFYQAPDRFQLPELRVKQPDSASLSPWRDEVQTVITSLGVRCLEGVSSVDGFVETVAKPGAVLEARTANGEPLLARWRHGLGMVAAWTSTLAGAWNAGSAADGSGGRAFAALVRELAPATSGVAALRLHNDRLHVRLPVNSAEVRVFVDATLLGHVESVAGDGAAWNVLQPVPVGVLRLEDTKGVLLAATVRAVESEWTRALPDVDELRRLEQLAATMLPLESRGALPLRTPLLFGALLLFLMTVLLRRTVLLLFFLCAVLCPQNLLAQDAQPGPVSAAALQRALQGTPGALEEALHEECVAHGDASRLLSLAASLMKDATPQARSVAARLALNAGQPARGLEFLAPIEAANVEQLLLRARLHEALGADGAAEGALVQALALDCDEAQKTLAGLRLAGLMFERGARAEALQLLQPMRGSEKPSALRFSVAVLAALHGSVDWLLEPAPVGRPFNFDEMLLAAALAMESGRGADAERLLLEARAFAPRSADRRFIDERTMAIHRGAGTLEQLAQRWIGADSADVDREAALVALLRELRRPEEALVLLRRGGVALDDRVQREIIALALECGRHDDVEAAYLQSITKEPQRLAWSQGLALLRLMLGRRDGAVQALNDALQRYTEGRQLLSLAAAAADLGLLEVEAAALVKALPLGGRTALRARISMAERAARSGDDVRSKELLVAAEGDAAADSEALSLLAECHERLQAHSEAIRVLRKIVSGSGAEDARMRLGWLLEQRKLGAEALDHWMEVWRSSANPARVRQAEDRLLDLGAKEGKLADIAIDIEKSLSAGNGDAKALGLLVKIYQRANDPAAALEVLREHGPRLGQGEVETLKTMALVYQHCDEYPRYEQALLRLQELQPEDALDLQQQLVLAALERGRGRAADRALQRLRDLGAGDSAVDEFAAGVLGMVQRASEAALAYGRVLARHPDRIESWLLMGNMLRNAGEVERGRQLFLALLEDADKDDLFTIAADGLLNLNAPAKQLRPALRRIRERIAVRPSSGFLWQLAADYEEELGAKERQRTMTVGLAAVSGERRGAYLRELFEMAREAQDPARVLAEGRALLALGEEFPPDLFIALGEAMIRSGDTSGAERVFLRARNEGDWLSTQKSVAALYARHGRFEDAERLIRQAQLARPDDPALLLLTAGYAEVRGDFESAAADAQRTLEVLLARSAPANISEAKDKPRKPERVSGRINRAVVLFGGFSYDPQQDSYSVHGQHAVRVLQCTGTFKTVEALKKLLQAERERLLAEAQRGERVADHPRFARIAAVVRDLSLALGLPEEVGAVVEMVKELFPKDKDAVRVEVNALAERGHLHLAAACADLGGLDLKEALPEQWRALLLQEPQRLLELAANEPDVAAPFVARLVLSGATDAARALVAALDPATCRIPAQDRGEFLAAVHGVCTPDVFERWWSASLRDALLGSDPLQAANAAKRLLTAARLLLPAERHAFVESQLAAATASAPEKTRTACLLLHRMSAPEGLSQDLPQEAFDQLAAGNLELLPMQSVLQSLSVNDRSKLLVLILAKSQGQQRYQLYGILTQGWADDARVADALVAAYRNAHPRAALANTVAQEYEALQLAEADTRSLAILPLIEVLSSEAGESVCINVGRGLALARAERFDEARAELRKALTALLNLATPTWPQTRALTVLASLKDPALVAVLDTTLQEMDAASLASTGALRFRVARALHLKQPLEALNLLTAAAPTLLDAELQNQRCEVLKTLGLRAEAAQAMELMLQKNPSDRSWLYNELAREWLELGQLARAQTALAKIDPEEGQGQDLLLAFAQEDERLLLRAWRQHASDAHRSEYSSLLPYVSLPNPITLYGLAGSGGTLETEQYGLLTLLLATPWGAEEAQRQLRGLRPDQAWSEIAHVLRAQSLDMKLAHLVARCSDGGLARSSREVLQRIAMDGDAPLAEAFRTVLLAALSAELCDADLGSFTALARGLLRAGDKECASRLWRFELARTLIEQSPVQVLGFQVDALQQPELHAELLRVLRAAAQLPGVAQDAASLAMLARGQEDAALSKALLERAMQSALRLREAGGREFRIELLAVLRTAVFTGNRVLCAQALAELRLLPAPDSNVNNATASFLLPGSDYPRENLAAVIEPLIEAAKIETGHSGLFACTQVLLFLERKTEAAALLPLIRERIGTENIAQHHFIDLARACGAEAEASAMERTLLDARTLHPLRIPRVLDALRATLAPTEFAALQTTVAQWADTAVLRRLAAAFRK